MPIRMIHKPNSYEKGIEVDVYHFHMTDEGDAAVVAWVPSTECWMILPLFTVVPLNEKKTLVE